MPNPDLTWLTIWIYTQTDLIERIHQSQDPGSASAATHKPTAASDASWQRRLELAHTRITELTELTAENKQLRHQLALAHGQIRSERVSPSRTPSTTQTRMSDHEDGR